MIKKIFISILSYVAFIFVCYYVWEMSWFVSIGLSLMLLIHEIGHIIALKRLHIPIKGMYFIPFFGAAVIPQKNAETRDHYAYIKYMGPFVGTLAVFLVIAIFYFTKDDKLIYIILIGAVINLINLIPITFLDGYGVLRGVYKRIEWLGIIMVLILGFWYLEAYIFTLFMLLISTIYSEENNDNFGFRLHEFILGIIYILVMMYFIIFNDGDFTDMIYAGMSIYMMTSYYIETKIKPQKEFIGNEILTPLTKKQKYLWGFRWVGLVLCLVLIIYYFTMLLVFKG